MKKIKQAIEWLKIYYPVINAYTSFLFWVCIAAIVWTAILTGFELSLTINGFKNAIK